MYPPSFLCQRYSMPGLIFSSLFLLFNTCIVSVHNFLESMQRILHIINSYINIIKSKNKNKNNKLFARSLLHNIRYYTMNINTLRFFFLRIKNVVHSLEASSYCIITQCYNVGTVVSNLNNLFLGLATEFPIVLHTIQRYSSSMRK